MKERTKKKSDRAGKVFVGSWLPNPLAEAVDKAAAISDLDRSKFIRKAVREKLAKHGIAAHAHLPVLLALAVVGLVCGGVWLLRCADCAAALLFTAGCVWTRLKRADRRFDQAIPFALRMLALALAALFAVWALGHLLGHL